MSNADTDIDDDFLDELIPQLEKHLVPHGSIDGRIASKIIARLRRAEAALADERVKVAKLRMALRELNEGLGHACSGKPCVEVSVALSLARAALDVTEGGDV